MSDEAVNGFVRKTRQEETACERRGNERIQNMNAEAMSGFKI